MNRDPWAGKPVSEIYKLAFENVKKRIEERGETFRQDKAIRVLAEMHAENVKDLIDENMTGYDKKQLTNIVERCVARYVTMEE